MAKFDSLRGLLLPVLASAALSQASCVKEEFPDKFGVDVSSDTHERIRFVLDDQPPSFEREPLELPDFDEPRDAATFSTAPGWSMDPVPPSVDGLNPTAWQGYDFAYLSVAHEEGPDPLVAHNIVHVDANTATACPYALVEDGVINWPFASEASVQVTNPGQHGLGLAMCGLGSYGYNPNNGLNDPNVLWFKSVSTGDRQVMDSNGNVVWTIPGNGLARLERPDPSVPWNESQITAVWNSSSNPGGAPGEHLVGIARAFPDSDLSDGVNEVSGTNYANPTSPYFVFDCGIFTMNPNGSLTVSTQPFAQQNGLPVNCWDAFYDGTFAPDGSPYVLAGIFATANWAWDQWLQTLVRFPLGDPNAYEELMTSTQARTGLNGGADPCTHSTYVMQRDAVTNLRIPHLVYPTGTPPPLECNLLPPVGDDDDSGVGDDDDSGVGDDDDSGVGDDDDSGVGDDDDSGVGDDDDSGVGDDDDSGVGDDDDSGVGDDPTADDDDSTPPDGEGCAANCDAGAGSPEGALLGAGLMGTLAFFRRRLAGVTRR